MAYPELTAQALGAAPVNPAYAGKGITRDLADSDNNTMPVIYNAVQSMTLSLMYDCNALAQYLQTVQAAASQSMSNVYYFEFLEYDGALRWGCDGHPDAAAHVLMASQLTAAIQAHVSW